MFFTAVSVGFPSVQREGAPLSSEISCPSPLLSLLFASSFILHLAVGPGHDFSPQGNTFGRVSWSSRPPPPYQTSPGSDKQNALSQPAGGIISPRNMGAHEKFIDELSARDFLALSWNLKAAASVAPWLNLLSYIPSKRGVIVVCTFTCV